MFMCVSLCLSVFIGMVMIRLSLLPYDYELKQSWWRDLFVRKMFCTCMYIYIHWLVCVSLCLSARVVV